MAKLGTFGSLTFTVSDKKIRTFNDMGWDFSASYATHDRHIKADLLEFLGPDVEEINFSMIFSVFTGTNPFNEIKKLRKMVRNGRAERLVIGGKVYGSFKWVIQKCSVELQRYDNKGNLWMAKVNVTMKEYPAR